MRRDPAIFARSVLASALLSASPAKSLEPVVFEAGPDWDVTLSGQVRPRIFLHSGRDFRGSDSEWREYVTQRARVGVLVEEASGLAFQLQIQDVRIWGEEENGTTDFTAAGLDAHQAWARIPFYEELKLTIGRQEIVFDEERLVGNLDWTQRGRSFDGVRLSWAPGGGRYTVDALYAKIQEPGQDADGNTPDGVLGDIDFGGVHASIELVADHEISPLYLVNANQAADELRHTAGLGAEGEVDSFFYRAELYYQFGEIEDQPVDAFLAAGRVGYTFDVPVEPTVIGWAEALSGNGSLTGAFDTLYGTNHDYYGEMDFFFSIPRDTNNFGLVDLGGRIGTGVVEGLTAHVDAHYFRTFETTADGSSLGVEVEPTVVYQPMDGVTFRTLYGIFLPGDAMRAVRGTEPGDDLEPEHLFFLTTDVQF